ncbi:OsmC family protein [Albibacterium profundi]|uniref:OsmC family protein n=1 Tax=Albibacterium profundi TaxID=3134906 RepID=A0ABV5CHD9_9SPHI
MNKHHKYNLTIRWTGNKGHGTFDSRLYGRDHRIVSANKPDILGSSDPSFRGDKNKHNPEELLVASLSSCHMLWYLDLCASAGVVVVDYHDNAVGIMEEKSDRSGQFIEVTLQPVVTVAESSMVEIANDLHKEANRLCFIANSVNFPVYHNAHCLVL